MSVLFADIAGSTALIEQLDAEQTAAILDRPVQLMASAVEQFDGTVSHLGDGVMAVFGAPSSAGEDHAVRACLAALRMRDGIEAAAGEGPGNALSIQVRIGIHTGDVMMRARRLGRAIIWEPIGPALHVAARLEQTAEPGTICISSSTEAQARGFIEAVPLAPVHAKGLSEPLRRWALHGMRRDRDRWSVRAARGLVGFVGRTEELAALRRFLAGAPRNRPLVVQVTGPAGIGKSRLLHEALGREETGSALVARLAGDPHGRDAAYHAFAVWLRGWAGISPGDPADAARRALRAQLDGSGADAEALERLLGLQGTGPPAPFGRMEAIDAGGAVAAVLLSASGGRRIVLACEDIDCFDTAGRGLLLDVLDRLRDRDVLVLATSRSRHRLGREWETKVIALDALGEADTLAFLQRMGGGALGRADLAAAIHARTGGNPLFVEEVAALAARSGSMGDLPAIPDRVESLIGDRLDKLPRAQKHLLQVGAVLGGVIPLRLLAQVLGEPEAALHARLLRLQGEHVLHQVRRDPDPEFAFDHALLRDAAYQMMPAARRRELHARVVGVLEAGGGTGAERLNELSHHAVRASLPQKAIRYLYEAAGLDAAKSAFQLARGRLDQALELSRALPESDAVVARRIELLLAQRVMLGTANDYKALLGVLDETEALADRVGDTASKVVAMVQRVHVLGILGRLRDAVALGEAALEAARRHGNDGQVVAAAHYLAQALFNLGRLREADRVLEEAATLLGKVEPGPAIGRSGTPGVLVYCTRALTLTLLGDGPGAIRMADAALQLARDEGRPYDEAFALFAAGVAQLRPQPAVALDALSRGAALCETWRLEQLVPPVRAGLGHAMLRCGDAEGAVAHLEVARAGARTSGRPMMQSWAASGLALARHAQGAADEARSLADEAVALAEGSGYRGYLVIALRAKGAVFPGAAGERALRDALALATELEMRAEADACRAALASHAPMRCRC